MAGLSKFSYHVTKCCIIGLGLIGGSLGLALGKHGIAPERWGYDVKSQTMKEAQKKGAVDKTGSLVDSLRDADLVILAAPVGKIPPLLGEIAPHLSSNALVTDVGSSKRVIVKAMQNVPSGMTCLGGHPMAGSELSGIGAANGDLFKGAIYFLTPDKHTPAKMLGLMQNIICSIGARPIQISPEEHDRIMAPLSHLPKLVSATLVNVLGKYGAAENALLSLTGKGFKDTTRIAAGDPQLWLDIFESNKDNLRDALALLLEELQAIAVCLDGGDKTSLTNSLEKAAALRGILSNK